MNPHLKIAFIIAPILAIGGYGIAEFYYTQFTKAVTAPSQTQCKILKNPCTLTRGDLSLILSLHKNQENKLNGIKLDSNHGLNGLFLGWVSHNKTEHAPQPMTALTRQNWVITDNQMLNTNLQKRKDLILRIAAEKSGKYYISEVIVRF